MNRIIPLLLLSSLLASCSSMENRAPASDPKCDAAIQACQNYTAALQSQNTLLSNQVTTVTQQRDQCGNQLASCTAGNPTSPVILGGVGLGGIVAASAVGGPAGGLGAAAMFLVVTLLKIHF
jgi:hypothetical protein